MNVVTIDLTPGATEEDGVRVEPTADGVVVDFAPQEERPQVAPGSDNLAEGMDTSTLATIGMKMVELVKADEESRRDWYDRWRKGLEKCGALPAEIKPSFAGESTAIHPLLMEAVTQFQARAIEELFPSSGPVKAQILGEPDEEAEAQRDRVEAHMNYQIQVEDDEYFWDCDQMLFVLGFAGSAFKKTYIDPDLGVVISRFLPAENVILPYRFRGHITRCPRVTHAFPLSHDDFLRRQAAGAYLSMEKLQIHEPMSDAKESDSIAVAADGVQQSSLDEDREHQIYEVHIDYAIPGQDELAKPYIITVEADEQKVLAIRENAIKHGPKQGNRRCWFTHYKLLPGFGAYGYGFIHAIGGLGEAATEALQELLHAAKYSSRQGGFKSREARITSKVTTIEPGVWKDTEMTPDELRNAFFNPPFKEPSPALFQLLGFLTQAGQRFASITEAMVGEGGENTPVGTTIARIEQGSKVYSSIHKRLHKAAGEEFRLRAELNRELLESGAREFMMPGSRLQIAAEDYDERIDIVPVSDPNIVSTPQRIALAQTVVQRAQIMPGLYDKYEAEKRFLKALKVPEIDQVLPKQDKLPPLDAVSEGQAVMVGRPFKAYAEQDHGAHLMVHQGQMMMLKGSPFEQQAMPALMAHMADHMAHQYRIQMSMQIGIPLPPLGTPKEQSPVPPEVDAQISTAAAAAVQQQMMAMQAQMAQQGQPPADPRAEEMADLDLEERRIKLEKARAELHSQDASNAVADGSVQQGQALMGLVQQIAGTQQELQAVIMAMSQQTGGVGDVMTSLAELLQRSMEQNAQIVTAATQRGEVQSQTIAAVVDGVQQALEQTAATMQTALDQMGNETKETTSALTQALTKAAADQKAAIDALAKTQQERASRPIVVKQQGKDYVVERGGLQ